MKSTSLLIVVLLLAAGLANGQMTNKGWWRNAVFYQVYPRSFMDSNNDGIGDLEGIRSKLSHFKMSGITGIWLSPIYTSPMVDFGYDIADFKDIDKNFGSLEDLKNLVKDAKRIDLKVILDLVPNHTSNESYWFAMSVNRIGKYKDYYIWADCGKNGINLPNNWLSVFNHTAWTYHPQREQCYYHQFYKQQPDLNYRNPEVQQEMKDVIKFWLDRGIDGFRIDAVPHLFETNNLTLNEPKANITGVASDDFASLDHIYTKDQPETYKLIQSWRDFVDEYADQHKTDEKVLMTEAYTSWENTLKYYKAGSNIPFNFKFITDANANSNATQIKNIIDHWINQTPPGNVANWVMGNHDRSRLATRFPGRADQMVMLEMILPGVAVTYYGEEIGMEDNTTLNVFDFRDGCRTPFQWDNSTNAGFSHNQSTWLPVHSNYLELNLKNQKEDPKSYYTLYTTLTSLRKSRVLKYGTLKTEVLEKNVLAVIRDNDEETVTLLINFAQNMSTVDLSKLVYRMKTNIKVTSVNSGLTLDGPVRLSSVKIPAKAAVVLVSGATMVSYSLVSLVLLLLASLLHS